MIEIFIYTLLLIAVTNLSYVAYKVNAISLNEYIILWGSIFYTFFI